MGIKIGDSMVETQTIDIEHVQKILKNCPNYDIIVNSEFPFEDTFSDKLVDWYRELVFSANGNNEGQLKIINALDKSIYLYESIHHDTGGWILSGCSESQNESICRVQ